MNRRRRQSELFGRSWMLVLLLLIVALLSQNAVADGRQIEGSEESSSSSDVGDAAPSYAQARAYTPGANADEEQKGDEASASTSSAVGGKISMDEMQKAESQRDAGDGEGAVADEETGVSTPNPDDAEGAEDRWPSFLSATVLLKLSPVSATMDSARQAIFSTAITVFLEKVFHAQTKYDITVASVNLIQQVMVSEVDRRLKHATVRRRVEVNILEVETVITTQYIPQEDNPVSKDDFKRMLSHVFRSFEDAFIEILQSQEAAVYSEEDEYFASVENALLEVHLSDDVGSSNEGGDNDSGGGGLNVVGITLFIVGGIAVAGLLVLLFTYHREHIFDKARAALATGKKMISSYADETTYNLHDIGRKDTYSFSSQEEILRTSSRLKKSTTTKDRKKNRKLRFGGNEVMPLNFEDMIAEYDLSERLGRKPSKDGSTYSRVSSAATEIEMDNETGTLRSECYAPPGKLGAAIDTVDGQPVVHRIKHGSPLEGVLRHMDRIVAIDGVDTTSMSAADVTYLMVKSMNRVRKITFVRRIDGSNDEEPREADSGKSIDPDIPKRG